MSIASRINEITNHLTDDWQSIQNIGGDTSIDNNIENISQALEDLYDEMPKVSSSGTDLSLNDTRKGRLSLDLKGNTYQKTLPSTYTAVDYIESSGTQYIDTGYKHNTSKTSYELNISIDTLSNPFNTLFGARTTYNNSDAYYLGVKNDYSTFGCIGGNHKNSIGWNVSVGTKYNIVYNATEGLIVDGTTYSIPSQSNTTCSYNDCIFALNEAGTIKEQIKCKLYYFEIYEDDDLVRNFIPCYRNNDNEVGLYDLVNDTFYTNQGTGTFTYGTTSSIPNPDIPIPINVVSGDNEIKVEGVNRFIPFTNGSITGTQINETSIAKVKQTFNYTNVLTFNNGEITGYPKVGNGGDYIWALDLKNLKPNTNYTISCDYEYNNLTGTTGNLLTLNTLITAQTGETSKSGTAVKSFTTDANGDAQLINFINTNLATCDETSTMRLYNFQLLEGTYTSSTIPTYTPYQSQTYPISLGNMELCKIGDYQDYIYKENGKWYLHKEIGKVVLNDSENWHLSSVSPQRFLCNFGGGYSDATKILILSNYFKGIKYNDRNNVDYPSIYLESDYIGCNKTGIDTLVNFTTWLSTHNTEGRYVLATPTITEITDTTLINQLNNIYKAQSYKEQTNISQTNNDLPFIINASALKEWSE